MDVVVKATPAPDSGSLDITIIMPSKHYLNNVLSSPVSTSTSTQTTTTSEVRSVTRSNEISILVNVPESMKDTRIDIGCNIDVTTSRVHAGCEVINNLTSKKFIRI